MRRAAEAIRNIELIDRLAFSARWEPWAVSGAFGLRCSQAPIVIAVHLEHPECETLRWPRWPSSPTIALVSCGAPSAPDFVQKAAMSDMYEVEAGKIAAEKGKSDAVRQFGQHMVEAHSQTTEELKGIVRQEKISVELPTKLDDKHQRMIDDLNAAHPEDFDKTYAKQQVSAHEKAEDLFSKYADKGDNQAVKTFVARVLPVIKQHLEEAKKLAQ
jgi:predicted outer membrane protein